MTDGDPVPDAPPDDSVAKFAADLRLLRLEADSPTLSRLQNDSGVSRSVLSEAFAGRTLPSARTVSGLVRACGADPAPWLERRHRLVSERRDEAAEPEPVRPAASPRRRLGWTWAVGAFALGAVVGATIAIPLVAPHTPADAEPLIGVASGEDPGRTRCIEDADVVSSETGPDNALLEIIWSDACQAGWARITRYDDLEEGNVVSAAIFPETSPDGALRQATVEHDVTSAYTTLVVRPTPETLLCATGSFTVDGVTVEIGALLCT